MKALILLMVFLLCSCQVEHKGQVDHVFAPNFEKLELYFTAVCLQEVPEDEVDECVVLKVGLFLDGLVDDDSDDKS